MSLLGLKEDGYLRNVKPELQLFKWLHCTERLIRLQSLKSEKDIEPDHSSA